MADKEGAVRLVLNEKAKGLMGRGARKIEVGELLHSRRKGQTKEKNFYYLKKIEKKFISRTL